MPLATGKNAGQQYKRKLGEPLGMENLTK